MRRTYWASGTALAIVIAFLYLFFNADNSGKPMQSFLKASSSAEEGSAAKVKVSSGVDGAGEMPMENKLTKEEMIEAMVAGSNRQVDFYGEIVDQHGDAVPGVEVDYMTVLLVGGLIPQASPTEAKLVTDAAGRLHISGMGYTLNFNSFKKPGYVFQADGRASMDMRKTSSIDPGPPKTSAEEPWVFRAWKLSPPADLVHSGTKRTYGGYFYDFRSLRFEQDGDFHPIPLGDEKDLIQIAFDVPLNATRISRQPWAIKLKANGGGLIAWQQPFMFEAPSDGYQREWSKRFETLGNGDVRGGDSGRFFFRARAHSGKVIFGRMDLQYEAYAGLSSDRGFGVLRYRYWLNPTGSPNLTPLEVEPQSVSVDFRQPLD